ncbi:MULTISPECIES: DUF799 domain-containing protein [unclassified Campylobacter]|uniref:DUF799 domain-containing protein n=1 Tax=unclassified Campylobacter TaxID=2593542 RepID=UPI003D3404E1
MKILQAIFLSFILLFFVACASPKAYDYSNFIQSNPRSILVLMPTNETTEIRASAAVVSNSLVPLAEAGYYVFPMALVYETFKANGISEPSEIAQVPLSKLKKIFNPDAVLYINVTQYGTSYQLINSKTSVSLYAKLIDANTANTLWEKSITAQQDSGSGNSGLLGMVISAMITQIADTISDKGYEMSAQATSMLFARDCYDCLLRGSYSPKYRQDLQITK